jgi:hypothetical protein
VVKIDMTELCAHVPGMSINLFYPGIEKFDAENA